jgi:hypothetical protein
MLKKIKKLFEKGSEEKVKQEFDLTDDPYRNYRQQLASKLWKNRNGSGSVYKSLGRKSLEK